MLGKNLEPQETIDAYNSWCIVWEPPGEQPAPWTQAKNSVPRELEEVPPPVAWGSHTGIFPVCIWTRPPSQTFPADPLRSQVSWTLGCGTEGDFCRSKTPHPLCTRGRAIMSIPPPCAGNHPVKAECGYPFAYISVSIICFFTEHLWNKFMFLVLAT